MAATWWGWSSILICLKHMLPNTNGESEILESSREHLIRDIVIFLFLNRRKPRGLRQLWRLRRTELHTT